MRYHELPDEVKKVANCMSDNPEAHEYRIIRNDSGYIHLSMTKESEVDS